MNEPVRLHPADSFGEDYLAEFSRIVDTHLGAAPRVLEWGAGHTTHALLARLDAVGCRLFVSVDDDAAYLSEVLRDVAPRPWFRPIALDRIGPKTGQRDPEPAYSTWPLLAGMHFDFVYIDGRRRMECALIAALLAHEGTTVVIHDYRRGRYQPIRALFDVVEDGPQFRVLRARPALVSLFADRTREIVADVRAANPSDAARFDAAARD